MFFFFKTTLLFFILFFVTLMAELSLCNVWPIMHHFQFNASKIVCYVANDNDFRLCRQWQHSRKCKIELQQVTATCSCWECMVHCSPSARRLMRRVFGIAACLSAYDIGWTVADSGPFKCPWYTVQQQWIIFHSSACYQSQCEVKGKRRQGPACCFDLGS